MRTILIFHELIFARACGMIYAVFREVWQTRRRVRLSNSGVRGKWGFPTFLVV
jgi:hypothetical protein